MDENGKNVGRVSKKLPDATAKATSSKMPAGYDMSLSEEDYEAKLKFTVNMEH